MYSIIPWYLGPILFPLKILSFLLFLDRWMTPGRQTIQRLKNVRVFLCLFLQHHHCQPEHYEFVTHTLITVSLNITIRKGKSNNKLAMVVSQFSATSTRWSEALQMQCDYRSRLLGDLGSKGRESKVLWLWLWVRLFDDVSQWRTYPTNPNIFCLNDPKSKKVSLCPDLKFWLQINSLLPLILGGCSMCWWGGWHELLLTTLQRNLTTLNKNLSLLKIKFDLFKILVRWRLILVICIKTVILDQ